MGACHTHHFLCIYVLCEQLRENFNAVIFSFHQQGHLCNRGKEHSFIMCEPHTHTSDDPMKVLEHTCTHTQSHIRTGVEEKFKSCTLIIVMTIIACTHQYQKFVLVSYAMQGYFWFTEYRTYVATGTDIQEKRANITKIPPCFSSHQQICVQNSH